MERFFSADQRGMDLRDAFIPQMGLCLLARPSFWSLVCGPGFGDPWSTSGVDFMELLKIMEDIVMMERNIQSGGLGQSQI